MTKAFENLKRDKVDKSSINEIIDKLSISIQKKFIKARPPNPDNNYEVPPPVHVDILEAEKQRIELRN